MLNSIQLKVPQRRQASFLLQMQKIEAYKGETLKLGTMPNEEIEVFYVDFELLTGTFGMHQTHADRFFQALNTAVTDGHVRKIYFVNFDGLNATTVQSDFFKPLQNFLLQSPSLETLLFPDYFYKTTISDTAQLMDHDPHAYTRRALVEKWGNTVDGITVRSFLKNAFITLSKRVTKLYQSMPSAFPQSVLTLIGYYMDNKNGRITWPADIRGEMCVATKMHFAFRDVLDGRTEFDLSQPAALPRLLT